MISVGLEVEARGKLGAWTSGLGLRGDLTAEITGPVAVCVVVYTRLNLKACIASTAAFKAINSLPNVDVSTVFCCLLYQMIGARFTNMSMPVCDRRVAHFAALSASTNNA